MRTTTLPLFPESASTVAPSVDRLYVFLIVSTVSLAVILAVLVIGFAIRYHRGSQNEIPVQSKSSHAFEYAWTVATFLLFLAMFFWGVNVYFELSVPPPNSLEVFAVGKQWMWKVQYPGGQREINELHVPIGTPVRVTMTSQDVIHSFFIPAFRVKQDVLPGRYTTLWFTATKPGRYHLFCAEYCGTKHSGMVGWVYAMAPAEYSRWLTSGGSEGSLASRGEKLYHQYGCSTCHDLEGGGPCPSFRHLYGTRVRLDGGGSVIADEAYLRESILQADAKVVLGFKPIMPTFQGQLDEDQVLALIEFIKALAPTLPSGQTAPVGDVTAPGGAATTGARQGTSIAGSKPEQR